MSGEKKSQRGSTRTKRVGQQERESSHFQGTFTQYSNSIQAVREFFSNVCPVVTEIEKGRGKRQEAYLKELFNDFRSKATAEESQELTNFFDFIEGLSSKGKTKKRFTFSTKSPLLSTFIDRIFKSVSGPSKGIHSELLNRSILMSLVSYFEVLVAELAHAFYRIAPNAISSDDKVLSVKELKRFNSIEDALRSIVSGRIDKLLGESISGWREFFQSNMKIDLKKIVPDWAIWNEYFQRRHIVVHAGGRVTELYLSRVDWKAIETRMKKPSLGDVLSIEDIYIENAINDFEISGLLLCQEVWRKLIPRDSGRYYGSPITGIGILEAVYNRLLSGHWYVAEQLATWGENDNEAIEDAMLICKFNRWLCKKRQGHWHEVEAEVKAFDCMAKNRKYVLARASLLELADEFYEILPKALSAADIDLSALEGWPILEEMRKDPRFKEIIEKANH